MPRGDIIEPDGRIDAAILDCFLVLRFAGGSGPATAIGPLPNRGMQITGES